MGARAAVDAAGELGAAEGWKSEEAGAEVAAGGGVAFEITVLITTRAATRRLTHAGSDGHTQSRAIIAW